jgi:hypothetical protein
MITRVAEHSQWKLKNSLRHSLLGAFSPAARASPICDSVVLPVRDIAMRPVPLLGLVAQEGGAIMSPEPHSPEKKMCDCRYLMKKTLTIPAVIGIQDEKAFSLPYLMGQFQNH